MGDEMMTIRDVAEQFQVSPMTIRRWVAAGVFPAPLKIGGSIRFRSTDIEQFVASGWLDNRAGRPGGIVASGWLPDQADVEPDQLADADDLVDADMDEQFARLRREGDEFLDQLADEQTGE